MKAKINNLKAEVNALRESQQFILKQNDDLNKNYKSAVLSNKQQKLDITKLNKRTDNLMKLSCDEELKIDELEQYNWRQI